MKVLLVIDMQNDFIDGSLGTNEAQLIVNNVKNKIKTFEGKVIYTRDTHFEDYLETQEGRKLPVKHCIKGTDGWRITKEFDEIQKELVFDKLTFGSKDLAFYLEDLSKKDFLESITVVGLCTDICVISNALLIKAFLPEVPIIVDALCCAGVTPESHKNALEAMKMCQIEIEND